LVPPVVLLRSAKAPNAVLSLPVVLLSQEAWSALQKLWEIYRSADIPGDERTQIFYSASLQQMNNLSDGRRTRLFASHGKVPTLMWVLLWLEGTIILGFTYFFGVRSI